MSDQGMKLATTALEAFERPRKVAQSHQKREVSGLAVFLRHLWTHWQRRDSALGDSVALSHDEFERLRLATEDGLDGIAGIGSDRTKEALSFLVDLQILTKPDKSDQSWCLSGSGVPKIPGILPGTAMMAAATPEAALRLAAHNYLLVYPEAMFMLRAFAPPGCTKAAAQRLSEQYCFCRKLNDTNSNYCVYELETFGMIRNDGHILVQAPPLPPSAQGFFLLEAALQVSQHRPDTQIRTATLVQQLEEWMAGGEGMMRQNDLHGRMGMPEPILRREVSGAQVRLTWDSFQRCVDMGLVDPLQVGQVLLRHGEASALQVLGEGLLNTLNDLKDRPANLDQYLRIFSAPGAHR